MSDHLTRLLHQVTSPVALQLWLLALSVLALAVGNPSSAVTAAVGCVIIGAVRGVVAQSRGPEPRSGGHVTVATGLPTVTRGDMRHAKVTPPKVSYQNGVIGQRETT